MTPAPVHIGRLADHAEHLMAVAGWVYEQWWRGKVAGVGDIAERLREQGPPGCLPLTLVALAAGRPVGCASLIHSDMKARPHLSPWLAAVFVLPEFRNRGVGTALVTAAADAALAAGVRRLYLATPDRQAFYARLGWSAVEEGVGPANQTVMARALAPTAAEPPPAPSPSQPP